MGRTDDFKRISVSFPLYSAELRPFDGLSVEFELGDSRAGKAAFMQHEWLKANNQILYLSNGVVWDSPQYWDYSGSTADISAEARQYTANLYLRVFKSRRGAHKRQLRT
jgi:hypothetical protein